MTTIGTIHLFTKFGRRAVTRTTGTLFDASVLHWISREASKYVFDSQIPDGADLGDCIRFGIAIAGLEFSRHASA
ncbi:hypothetical protein [Paraburkholderia sp. BCC1876]|uniref:hypothetical protein n=1 Tax=Paraburkholderia sp. BCC1876 TaxID=2676303 RepID=UPI001592364B|nr:hypothetical protein [Paraburkholderia sp. BCC1876]